MIRVGHCLVLLCLALAVGGCSDSASRPYAASDAAVAAVTPVADGGSGGRGGTSAPPPIDVTDSTDPTDATGDTDVADAGEPEASDRPMSPVDADEAPIGWAAVPGDGVATTDGGAKGNSVTPRDAAELLELAKSEPPLVIRIRGRVVVPRLEVASNKTLVGEGPDAMLIGGVRIRGRENAFVTNVVIRNLRIHGVGSDVDGDAVQIHYAHHVWVDHCEIWDGADGNLDIVHASNWVTVSWTKFRYSDDAPDPQHRFSNLIGHTDDNDEDQGRLKVTFHHDFWGPGVVERMPRVRYGDVHLFNNHYAAEGNNYAIGAGFEARGLIENNYFERVRDPHRFYDAEPTAEIVARGNVYADATGARDSGQGSAFVPPYPYVAEDAEAARAAVALLAGPR